MWTIARTNASDGLGKDFFGLLLGAGFAAGIDLGKISGQPSDEFVPALSGESRGLNGADTDLFVFQHTPPEQAFNDGLLVRREIFSVVYHGAGP